MPRRSRHASRAASSRLEAFYSHIPLGIGRLLKAIHNGVFSLLNKLDRFDRHRIFSRGCYALVEM
jgi:hypothetical protein